MKIPAETTSASIAKSMASIPCSAAVRPPFCHDDTTAAAPLSCGVAEKP
jgi:hypothetical protein